MRDRVAGWVILALLSGAIYAACSEAEAGPSRTRGMLARVFVPTSVASDTGDAGYDAGYDAGLSSEKATLLSEGGGTTDHVLFADRAGFAAGSSGTRLSVSCWIRMDDTASDSVVINQWNTGQLAFHLAVHPSAAVGSFVFYVSGDGSATPYERTTGTPLSSTGTWYQVGAAYDGNQAAASDRIVLYANGTLQAGTNDATTPPTSMFNSTADLAIGADLRAISATSFAGHVDECAIFQCTLSAGDMSTIYNSGTPKHFGALSLTCQPSWWDRMGENPGSGTTQNDEQGGAVGTCTNMTATACTGTARP